MTIKKEGIKVARKLRKYGLNFFESQRIGRKIAQSHIRPVRMDGADLINSVQYVDPDLFEKYFSIKLISMRRCYGDPQEHLGTFEIIVKSTGEKLKWIDYL